jgi:hypothetical protein
LLTKGEARRIGRGMTEVTAFAVAISTLASAILAALYFFLRDVPA